jgi:peptidoglycan lytic transglycosylase
MRRRIAYIGFPFLVTMAAIAWLRYHTTQYDDLILQAAARNGLDFYLVKALIFEESWFRPGIRGPAGEVGLMQITMAAANDFTVKKGFAALYPDRLLEPELNIEIGCWYLAQSMAHYRNAPLPVLFALLRYNAGEARTDHWLREAAAKPVPQGISPERYYLSKVDFPNTRNYVGRILQRSRDHNFWF